MIHVWGEFSRLMGDRIQYTDLIYGSFKRIPEQQDRREGGARTQFMHQPPPPPLASYTVIRTGEWMDSWMDG